MSSATNELVSSLQLARSEAIKRRSREIVCPPENGRQPLRGLRGLAEGWLVFHEANNNAALDAGERVIMRRPALPAGLSLTGNLPVSQYILYSPAGSAKLISGAWQLGMLILCDASRPLGAARKIIISSSTGRPRTVRVTLASCP